MSPNCNKPNDDQRDLWWQVRIALFTTAHRRECGGYRVKY